MLQYFSVAGVATLVDIFAYFITFNYILKKQDFEIAGFVVSAPTLSLIISYSIGLLANFLLTLLLVFNESTLRKRIQFIRYLMVAFLVLLANYYLMSFLLKVLEWQYPTIARAFSAVVVGIGSFLVHKSFSFQVRKKKVKSESSF